MRPPTQPSHGWSRPSPRSPSTPSPPGTCGGGISATLNVYVDGAFHKAINLTSRYAWLYGNETNPGDSPVRAGRVTSTTRPT
nr:hypothetical protein GCM10020093_051190 [Planobispora longispora]